MAAKKQAAKARSAAEGASPYVQRVIEDAELRENVRVALENAKKAYGRLTNGKPATKVLDDKKLHKEVKQAAESLRDAGQALREGPKKKKRKRRGFAKLLFVGIIGAGAAHRPERGPAQQGPRHAVRGRGGVRLHVDHVARAVHGRRDGVLGLLATASRSQRARGRPAGRPSRVRVAALASRLAGQLGLEPWRPRPSSSARSRARRPSASSRRCARASPGAAWRARRSTTSRARRGVSRGLLHYYFGTKERLLAEVVRRDCELRMAALDDQLAPARDADDVIDALVASLKRYVEEEPEFITVVFELFTLSRRNEEIASEFAELLRRTREHVAELLARKQAEGALHLRAEPEAVADVLFSLADGICLRMLTETDHDFAQTLDAGVLAVRALLD